MKPKVEGYWLGSVESYQHAQTQAAKMLAPVSLRDLAEHKSKVRLDNWNNPAQSPEDDTEEEDGYQIDVSHMTSVVNGVGIIRIDGTLTNDYSPANYYWGEVSYDEIAAAAMQMANNPDVSVVLMDISSPGGDACGIERGSSALDVLAKAKPLYTYTASQMCSAGFWLGCSGKQIWAAPLATVGSIGVVAIHKSYQENMAQQGIKVTVMREGQYKMLINPFEDLPKVAEEMMQTQMGIIYEMFLGRVSDKRGVSVESLRTGPAQGQTFLGVQAVKTGLIDQVGDFSKLVNQLRSRYASQATGTPGTYQATERGLSMKIFTRDGKQFALNARGQAAITAGLSEDEAAKNDEFLEEIQPEAAQTEEEKAAAEAAEKEAADKTAAEAAAEETTPVSASTVDSGMVMQMTDRLIQAGAEKAKLTADLAKAQEQIEQLKNGNAGLKRIAMTSINRMEIAMNVAPSKTEDFDSDSTIVSKFNRLENDFNGRFKPGAKAEHSTEELPRKAGTAAKPFDSSIGASAKNLTTLGQ